jgi:hypothetical protein
LLVLCLGDQAHPLGADPVHAIKDGLEPVYVRTEEAGTVGHFGQVGTDTVGSPLPIIEQYEGWLPLELVQNVRLRRQRRRRAEIPRAGQLAAKWLGGATIVCPDPMNAFAAPGAALRTGDRGSSLGVPYTTLRSSL